MNIKNLAKIADSRSSLILGLPREFWESTISSGGDSLLDILGIRPSLTPEEALVYLINDNFNDAMGSTTSPEEVYDVSEFPEYVQALRNSESKALLKRADKVFGVKSFDLSRCGGVACIYDEGLAFVGYYSGFTDKFNPAYSPQVKDSLKGFKKLSPAERDRLLKAFHDSTEGPETSYGFVRLRGHIIVMYMESDGIVYRYMVVADPEGSRDDWDLDSGTLLHDQYGDEERFEEDEEDERFEEDEEGEGFEEDEEDFIDFKDLVKLVESYLN